MRHNNSGYFEGSVVGAPPSPMRKKKNSFLGSLCSLLIIGPALLSGCGMSTATKAMVRSAKAANKRLVALESGDPMSILKGIKDSREEGPKITILEGRDQPAFAPLKYSSFIHLHPLDEKPIQQKSFSFRKFKVNLSEATLSGPEQLHKKLFFDSSKPVVTENVVLVDDFFPLLFRTREIDVVCNRFMEKEDFLTDNADLTSE